MTASESFRTETPSGRGARNWSRTLLIGVLAFALGLAGGAWLVDARGGSDNPSLAAMCLTLGEFDTGMIDRIEGGEGISLDDPDLARWGVIPILAMIAAADSGLEELREIGLRLGAIQDRLAASAAPGPSDFDEVRLQFDTLRGYCD